MADKRKFQQRHEVEGSAGGPGQQALARYLADVTRQHEAMARDSKLDLLAFLLAMARTEAESVSVASLDVTRSWASYEAVQYVVESRPRAAKKKSSLSVEASEIILLVTKWAGGGEKALRWYRSQPIAAFGDRTAESLVKSGQAEALRDYLDSLALGGYA